MPNAYLHTHNLHLCSVCGLLVSKRFAGTQNCPGHALRCWTLRFLKVERKSACFSLGPPARNSVPDVSAEQVLAAVRSFRRGSAAGPTRLRGDHVREALGTAHSDKVTVHLVEIVRVLLAGEAPPELAPHLAGVSLHAAKRR